VVSHGLLREKPALCPTILVDFLTSDAVPTFVRSAARPRRIGSSG